jgi:hypothetical protein
MRKPEEDPGERDRDRADEHDRHGPLADTAEHRRNLAEQAPKPAGNFRGST